jgi:hypothetical protein
MLLCGQFRKVLGGQIRPSLEGEGIQRLGAVLD